MRATAKAGLLIAWLALPGAAFGQSMLGNEGGDAPAAPSAPAAPAAPSVPEGPSPEESTVVVPPPPPIVSAPLAAPMPQVMTPQPAPPGLVQTPVPPADMDNGQAGTDGTGNADNGAPQPDASSAATPAAPVAPAPAGAPPAAPAAPDTADSTPPPPSNSWVPAKTAQIGLLDKVDGGASTIAIPVGGQTDAGDLQISVLACVSRPPGEIPDDAIFVSIQPVATGATGTASAPPPGDDGAATGAPIFRGWMVRSIPGATVVGDASETLRVVGCS